MGDTVDSKYKENNYLPLLEKNPTRLTAYSMKYLPWCLLAPKVIMGPRRQKPVGPGKDHIIYVVTFTYILQSQPLCSSLSTSCSTDRWLLAPAGPHTANSNIKDKRKPFYCL